MILHTFPYQYINVVLRPDGETNQKHQCPSYLNVILQFAICEQIIHVWPSFGFLSEGGDAWLPGAERWHLSPCLRQSLAHRERGLSCLALIFQIKGVIVLRPGELEFKS